MPEKIPEHWQIVDGMSGVYIERNVEALQSWKKDARIDVIHVPNWQLRYEVDVGHFSNDRQIQTAVSMFAYGVGSGIERGKEQARAEIRRSLGLEEAKPC